jgi:MOSC domain-containing protein YiiM
MEDVLGPGGYNAMRGHGGITAQVIEDGDFAMDDAVTVVP